MTTTTRSGFAIPQPARRLTGESPTIAFPERLLVVVIGLVWLTTVAVDFRVALSLLMAIGFGLAVIGLGHPRLGLLGIGMLCALNEIAAPFLLTGGWWRYNALNYWLIFVAFLFLPHILSLSRWQSRFLIALMLLLAVEILLSPDWPTGMQQVAGFSAVFGLLVYFRRVVRDAKAWYGLGVVSGVLAAGGSAAFVLQRQLGTLPYVNPNVWSDLPLTAMVGIGLAFVSRSRWFASHSCSSGCNCAAHYFSASLLPSSASSSCHNSPPSRREPSNGCSCSPIGANRSGFGRAADLTWRWGRGTCSAIIPLAWEPEGFLPLGRTWVYVSALRALAP